MRTLLHLVALIGGAALVYRGLSDGLPAWPLTSKEWGTVAAFGFGVMLALIGLRHVLLRVTGDDSALEGGMAVLVVALAVAVTAGAVKWSGRGASDECAQVIEHVRTLAVAHDPNVRFEELRPQLLRSCKQMTSEARKCPLQATSIDELRRCP
jgi:hypothetical protein